MSVFWIVLDSKENKKQYNSAFPVIPFHITPQSETEHLSHVGIFFSPVLSLVSTNNSACMLGETTKNEIKWKLRQLCAIVQMT